MGLLLKIVLFGVALYIAWTTLARWKGLFDRFVGRPQEPARTPPARPAPPAATAQARPQVIDASVPCAVCGAFLSSAATRCGRSDCPLP
jgi:hypothetical protein